MALVNLVAAQTMVRSRDPQPTRRVMRFIRFSLELSIHPPELLANRIAAAPNAISQTQAMAASSRFRSKVLRRTTARVMMLTEMKAENSMMLAWASDATSSATTLVKINRSRVRNWNGVNADTSRFFMPTILRQIGRRSLNAETLRRNSSAP